MLKYLLLIIINIGLIAAVPVTRVHEVKTQTDALKVRDLKAQKVIMFSSEWCGYCQSMKPIMAELSVKYQGKVEFFVIDVDSAMIQMNGVPVIMLTKDKKRPFIIEGAVSKEKLEKAIVDYFDVN